MSPETISVLISVVGFFFTCLGNAIILGIFLGGMKADMRIMGDRLAKIEGMFTLVPRREQKDVDQVLSIRLVFLDWVVPSLGIPAYIQSQDSVHTQ
jgi:hypothetical protein